MNKKTRNLIVLLAMFGCEKKPSWNDYYKCKLDKTRDNNDKNATELEKFIQAKCKAPPIPADK